MIKPIIVYGTSLSAERAAFWRRVGGQWVTLLRKWLDLNWAGAYTVVNASRWGVTSQWGQENLEKRVLNRNPACVILEFAVNDADVHRAISVSQSRENLKRMAEAIHSRIPSCRIVVLLTHPCIGPYGDRRPRLAEYYSACRDYARSADLDVIDLTPVWERWMTANPDAVHDYLPDGLHPAPKASRELIFPVVKQQMEVFLMPVSDH